MVDNGTQDRLLDAAVALFATDGFDGTSVRDITKAAGANQAAIHYHFGNKEGVLRAVTDRVVGPLNQRRNELLDELVAGADPPSSDDLLRAFLRADIETLQRLDDRGASARLMARIYGDPSPARQAMALEQFSETGARFQRCPSPRPCRG